ncbi:hypothetical protein [Serratia proteamaculans]
MGIKIALLVTVGVLLFILGFFFGGVDWDLAAPERATKVAFWTMLGGWVSGFSTLAAVVVSLYMAYTATQNTVEKLHISLAEFKEHYPHSDESFVRLVFKNLRNVRAEIINVGVQFDKMTDYVSIRNLKSGGPQIPHTLEKTGEALDFYLHVNSSMLWWGVFDQLDGPTFSNGFFVVETTMKRYELKMAPSVLNVFKTRYKMNEILIE